MKLVNLFEYDKRPLEIDIDHESTSVDSIEDYLRKHGGKQLGKGFFGIVYDKPRDVHTVIKRGRTAIDGNRFKDAYLHFIFNLMKDRRARGNPFLPQIYSLKIKRDSRQTPTYTYIIEIEKLEEFEDAGGTMTKEQAFAKIEDDPHSQFSQMISMLANLVNISEEQIIELAYYKYYDITGTLSISHMWSEVIQPLIRNKRHKSDIKIVNKQFLEAVGLLKRYKNDKVFYDLHAGNVMVRRTPYGPQLVITDPYS